MGEEVLQASMFSLALRNVNTGLYVFLNESATGKTCLKRLLDKCRSFGEPVSAFSYGDVIYGLRPLDLCKPTDRVVLLDRYDMYAGQFDEDVRLLAENTTVFVDAKSVAGYPVKHQLCMLHMDDPNHFRITGG